MSQRWHTTPRPRETHVIQLVLLLLSKRLMHSSLQLHLIHLHLSCLEMVRAREKGLC